MPMGYDAINSWAKKQANRKKVKVILGVGVVLALVITCVVIYT